MIEALKRAVIDAGAYPEFFLLLEGDALRNPNPKP